jgi:hypothetical protein
MGLWWRGNGNGMLRRGSATAVEGKSGISQRPERGLECSAQWRGWCPRGPRDGAVYQSTTVPTARGRNFSMIAYMTDEPIRG